VNFTECQGLERSILLSVQKKPKSISQIAVHIKSSIQTVSKTVERMQRQNLIIKTHDYVKDARLSNISINPKKIRIKKTHTFYRNYFLLTLLLVTGCMIFSFLSKNPYIAIGSVISVIPTFIYMVYYVYIEEDKVIVEKLEKIKPKEKVGSANKLVDNTSI